MRGELEPVRFRRRQDEPVRGIVVQALRKVIQSDGNWHIERNDLDGLRRGGRLQPARPFRSVNDPKNIAYKTVSEGGLGLCDAREW